MTLSRENVMELVIKEMASLLCSTEEMAAQFAQRVREQVNQSVAHAQILDVMQKIPKKRLSMQRVVAMLKKQQEKEG